MKISKDAERGYRVVRDTREQEGKGWTFAARGDCLGTIRQKLDTGDYSLEHMVDLLCIERKRNAVELATCLFDTKRFKRQLERMREFRYAYIVVECCWDDIVHFETAVGRLSEKLPYFMLTTGAVLAKLTETMVRYPNIRFIFAGDDAKRVVSSLLKRHWTMCKTPKAAEKLALA